MQTGIAKISVEAEESKSEGAKWTPEGAKWTQEGRKSCSGGRYPVPVRPVSGALRAKSPASPGDHLLKYIRSGPEGARGVLEGRVCLSLYVPLSVCVFLHVPFCTSYRTHGGSRDCARSLLKATLFSHRFFESFFEGFGIDFR